MPSSTYSPAVDSILRMERFPELGPGSPNRSMHAELAALTPETSFPQVHDRTLAMACISGLWLLHDFLDESHAISQEISTSTGSYWHAIMHRREPDPDNAKYWFRRVGAHPVLKLLAEQSAAVGYRFTEPFAFVDFAESVRGTGTPDEQLGRRVQHLEWRLLFDWCYREGMSGTVHASRSEDGPV